MQQSFTNRPADEAAHPGLPHWQGGLAIIGGRADCTWERLYLGGVLSAPSGLYLELYYNEVHEPESETSPGTVRSGSWRVFDFIGKNQCP